MSNTGVSKTRSLTVFLCLTRQCPSFVPEWRHGEGFLIRRHSVASRLLLGTCKASCPPQGRLGCFQASRTGLGILWLFSGLGFPNYPLESAIHTSGHQKFVPRPVRHGKPGLRGYDWTQTFSVILWTTSGIIFMEELCKLLGARWTLSIHPFSESL